MPVISVFLPFGPCKTGEVSTVFKRLLHLPSPPLSFLVVLSFTVRKCFSYDVVALAGVNFARGLLLCLFSVLGLHFQFRCPAGITAEAVPVLAGHHSMS